MRNTYIDDSLDIAYPFRASTVGIPSHSCISGFGICIYSDNTNIQPYVASMEITAANVTLSLAYNDIYIGTISAPEQGYGSAQMRLEDGTLLFAFMQAGQLLAAQIGTYKGPFLFDSSCLFWTPPTVFASSARTVTVNNRRYRVTQSLNLDFSGDLSAVVDLENNTVTVVGVPDSAAVYSIQDNLASPYDIVTSLNGIATNPSDNPTASLNISTRTVDYGDSDSVTNNKRNDSVIQTGISNAVQTWQIDTAAATQAAADDRIVSLLSPGTYSVEYGTMLPTDADKLEPARYWYRLEDTAGGAVIVTLFGLKQFPSCYDRSLDNATNDL